VIYYDKSVYLSCIVSLPTFKGFADEVTKFLQDTFSAKQLVYPMDFVPEVLKEMVEGGYPKFARLPFTLTGEEALVVLSRCLLKFNTFSSIRVQPTPARVNRDVMKEKDFARIVEDLLLQQDSISISQIWQTNDLPKVVYSNTETPLNGRLSRSVVATMPVLEGKKKPTVELVLEHVQKEVLAAIQLAKETEEKNYSDSKYQLKY
jgi:hypothetical protein